MKKSTKLLSVLLAVIMIFSSMSILASAKTYPYKTSDDIKALNGYGTTDSVTRLNSNVRADMVLDFLDGVLAGANIKMDLSVLGTLNLTSVDNALNSVSDLINGGWFAFGKGLIGDLKALKATTIKGGARRADSTNYTGVAVITEIFDLINENKGLINTILNKGSLNAGIVGSFVDLSFVNQYLGDLGGLVKGIVFNLFAREDDNQDRIAELLNKSASLDSSLSKTVAKLFTDRQSYITYKEDANGNAINNCTLPTAAEFLRVYYEAAGTGDSKTYTLYVYDASLDDYVASPDLFYRTEEVAGSGEYVFKTTTGNTIKFFEDGSTWLPSLAADLNSGALSTSALDLSKVNAFSLLYTFIPYVFSDLAPVVLNGSVKMLLAEWLGATKTALTADEVTALKASTDPTVNAFFNKTAGDYTWEWSDYVVANESTHYYRFVSKDGKTEQWFKLDTTTANPLFKMFNYSWNISDDFLNEFIPTSPSSTSMILDQINNILYKAVNTMFSADMIAKINWTQGDNSNLISNLRKAIQAILPIAPEYILSTGYSVDRYNVIVNANSTNQQIAANIAAIVVEQLVPQIILPKQINSLGEVAAVCVRELLTQLLPSDNFDALIYSDYSTRTLVTGVDNEYWLDVVLTMGIDVGMYYLNSIADVDYQGCDFEKTWTKAEFDADRTEANQYWEKAVDYVIDWALTDDDGATGAWKIGNLVDTTGLTIDMATDQDPWAKLDKILYDILPIEDILNITITDADTKLEQALRYNFVYALFNLDLTTIVDMFEIPDTSIFRTNAVIPAVIDVVRNLLNALLKYTVVPTSYTTLDTVLVQANLATIVNNLISALYANKTGLVKTALPFLNWFVGWSSNDQTFQAPSIVTPRFSFNADGNISDTIKIKNNANGMVRKYTDKNGNEAYDTHYVVEVTNIACDNANVTLGATTGSVAAGESLPITITTTGFTGMEPVKYTVSYKVKSATGSYISNGEVYSVDAYSYITNQDTQEYVTATAAGGIGADYSNKDVKLLKVNKYYFTTNAASTAESIMATLQNTSTVNASGSADKYLSKVYYETDGRNALAKAWFQPYSAVNTATRFTKDETISTRIYEVIPSVDRTQIPDGYYNMGRISVRTNKNFNYDLETEFYQYKDFDIKNVMNSYLDKKLSRVNFMAGAEADAAWVAYNDALYAVCNLVNQPYIMSTFETAVANNIENAVNTLDTAYKALQPYELDTTADTLETATLAMQAIEAQGGVDYQNYLFYRYVKYESALRTVEGIKSSLTAPTAPQNYIKGSSLSAEEIAQVINAETNADLKAYLQGTVVVPTAEETANYNKSLAEFEENKPNPNKIDVAIAAENLYLNFERLTAKASNSTFLSKEIAAANAAGYVEANYTAKTWGNYQTALTNATTVLNDAASKQSDYFEAKYQLMKTQNDLMLKANSSESEGAYTELDAYIAQAQSMLQNKSLFTFVGTDVTEAEAWSNLLASLGYVANIDLNNDGTTEAVQVFGSSAMAIKAADLYYTPASMMKIDAAVANLKAALSNFKAANAVVVNPTPPAGTVVPVIDEVEKIITGINPGTVDPAKVVENIKLTASGTTPEITVTKSKSESYGTGSVVKVVVNGSTTAVYTVVVYGDVNGDGAIDGFDTFDVDKSMNKFSPLGGVYDKAADTNHDGVVDSADYAQIKTASVGAFTISQK